MESLYSRSLQEFITTRPWPHKLRWLVVEFYDPACLKFKLYRENINALSGDDKLHLASLLNETLNAVHKQGVPIYTWVASGDGTQDKDGTAQ